MTSRSLALIATLALTLSAPAISEAQAPRPRVKFRAYPVDVMLDTMVFARDTVTATPAQAFEAVRLTYAALKIPREWADSANGQI
ncbi:MAG TPA: hypothetical protein VFV33_02185, partial [Gemmatimonadaceae bacterium]|nr:hypothetical protein [Gemmatimonadaceae bacterium]